MFTRIRGIARLFTFVGIVLAYLLRIFLGGIVKGTGLDRCLRIRREALGVILYAMGVRIEVEGTPPQGGGLLVCNHRSYLDPIVILKDVQALPVAKYEVSYWPLIGFAARVTGVLFVDRANQASRDETRKKISETIQSGYTIINYPEGTTHDEPQTIKFKSGAFREAAASDFTVYPTALDYYHTTDAWVGDDTFLPHFIRCFGKRRTYAKVRYGTPLRGSDAKAILRQSQAFIDQSLLDFRAEWQTPPYAKD